MINSELIKHAIYDLCVKANTELPEAVYTKILDAYNSEQNAEAKYALGLILENAKLSAVKKMPLCQDTGQVLVFLRAKEFPADVKKIVNESVQEAYEQNFFRKSVVKNALFDRTNSKTNTPCVVYTEIEDIEGMEIEILLKGAGSENVCALEMLSPTASEQEIIDFVVKTVKKAGAKACPPYFIGLGIGGTLEYAGLLSKKALLLDKNLDEVHENLANKIKTALNDLNIGVAGLGGNSTALDVKILTDFTHIACMPVAITINCHSSRHAKCVVKNSQVTMLPRFHEERAVVRGTCSGAHNGFNDAIKINTSEIEKIKELQAGQDVLLSGEIYTARDAAHKRLVEMMQNGEELPFEPKDKIIFYAGPCPASPNCPECATGSIGPTTSVRMDKYATLLYEKGVLATIGKGERSEEIKKAIKSARGVYFTAFGGIACYLAQKFVKKELVAFEDLGAEAIYRLEVQDFPLKVNFS